MVTSCIYLAAQLTLLIGGFFLSHFFITRSAINMSNINEQLASYKATLGSTVKSLLNDLQKYIPQDQTDTWHAYFKEITSTTKEELFNDITNLKVTPATTAALFTTFVSVLLASKLLVPSKEPQKSEKKPKKKKKKQSKAQKANSEIQAILDEVEETFVPQIDQYIERYKELSDEKKENTYNYIQEMLLKKLMKLDGVDVANNNVLRENRKKVIRFIQEHQSRLISSKRTIKNTTRQYQLLSSG